MRLPACSDGLRNPHYAVPALSMSGELLLVSTYSLSETSHHMSVSRPEDLSILTEWTGSDYVAWLTPQ